MKKRSTWMLAGGLLSLSVLLVVACSKHESASAASGNVVQSLVQSWSQAMPNGNSTLTATVKRIVGSLDYSDTLTVQRPDNAVYYFIRTGGGTGTADYLALAKHKDVLYTMGVFHAKDLRQIKDFYQTGKVSAGDSLSIFGMNDQPLMQWATTAEGHHLYKRAQTKESITTSMHNNSLQIKSSSAMHPLDFPAPPPGCTDYYWVVYDDDGFIYSITFLYEDCDDPDTWSGGSSDTPSDAVACELNYEGMIESETAGHGLVAASNIWTYGGSRANSYTWKCWNGNGWSLFANLQGSQTYDGTKWRWLSLDLMSLNVSPSSSYGAPVSATLISSTPYVIYTYDIAGMDAGFALNYSYYCLSHPLTATVNQSSHVDISIYENLNPIDP